ncbi:ComEC/Rec2 family competence protein, partial [Kitasatospora sp. NPDC056327]|uniref:ComEC/Rec2 family competence protein n=1 Tax=Kitasatospora sp. NPDC056327 TaxID=3345785 RepID=UPI0035E1D30C
MAWASAPTRNSGRCSPSDGPPVPPPKGGAVIATTVPTPGAHDAAEPHGALRPGDLRLLLPAVAAWVVTAVVLGPGPGHTAVLVVAAGAAAVLGLALLVRPVLFTRAGPDAHGPSRHRAVTVTAAGVLLTAAAATVSTLLHTADLHRGPLPELARAVAPAPEVGVDLTLTGDPRVRISHGGGSGTGQRLLTVDAVVDRVTVPDGVLPGAPGPRTVRTSTPVTVLVRGEETGAWERLLPSTRLATGATVRPPGERAGESAALVIAHGEPRQLAPPSLPQRIAGRLRAGLREATDDLPADARGLLPGLVVGDTSRLPDDLREAFRATDLAHLVAVSGANLAIVLGVLIGAPGRAGTAERGGLAALLGIPLRATALLGAAVTLAFVTICRPEPSVLRAAGTGLLGLLALATGRPRRAVPALAGTALLLVLLDPWLARSFGFLLSVLATTGLLVLGPRWADALRARGWPHRPAGAVGATAAAQALCAPVTVLFSGHVSLVGIPCNLLAELAVAPATLLGFTVLMLDPVWPWAARLLAEPAAVPAGWLAAVARRGAELPGAQLAWPGGWFGTASLAVGTVALCWAVSWLLSRRSSGGPGGPGPRRPRGWSRPVAVGVLLLVLLVVLLRPPPLARIATGWPPPDWRLVMCDVGQGDMLVLPVVPENGDRPDSAVVVDAGPDPGAADRCLRDLGIRRVLLFLATHFHADHVEGLPGVLRGRSVAAVEGTSVNDPPGEAARVAGWAAQAGVPLSRAARGERRSAGPGVSWEVLWPDGAEQTVASGANNASVALMVTLAGGVRVALLGDLEPPAQEALLSRLRAAGKESRVDVLKVAHHGSAHQDWELTAALRPRLALVSCGEGNPYGHPSPRTVDRLRALGSVVLRTDRVGDIAVTGDSPARLGAVVHPPAHRAGGGPYKARAAAGGAASGGLRAARAGHG